MTLRRALLLATASILLAAILAVSVVFLLEWNDGGKLGPPFDDSANAQLTTFANGACALRTGPGFY